MRSRPFVAPFAAFLVLSSFVLSAGLLAGPAQAAVVPVDPGPIAAGRPILGTGQNLPSMNSDRPYNVGGHPAATIEAYYDSGEALADQKAVTAAMRSYVDHWLDSHCGATVRQVRACKVAAIFDVDETLMSGYGYYVEQDPPFSWHPTTWKPFVESCGYEPNKPVVRLFLYLRDRGVRVSIISGGDHETQREYLIPCLQENGVSGWSHYILRKDKDDGMPAAQWKAIERAGLQKKHGLTILASIGDQVSDMANGHLKRGFLLPNPMYYLP